MKGKMSKEFYFDTYALIEIRKGNNKYSLYTKDVNIILNNLNLMELAFYLMRTGKEKDIQGSFSELSKNNADYDKNILIEASKMKFEYKKEKLSFVDCIGYCLAKRHKVKRV